MRSATRYLALTVTVVGLTSGCSLFSIENIPSPFPESLPYGEIVREIRLEGNKHTRGWVIEMAMDSEVGEPYTEESSRNDYLWLSQLGSFQSISFSTEPADDGIVLIVAVKEVSPYIPGISFALTQENGIEIGPSISSPNFLGWAGRASAYARFGGATNFGVRYWDPWVPGKSWIAGYGLKYAHIDRRNELDNFNETTDDLYIQVRRNLSNKERLGLRFKFLSVKSDTAGITLDPDNRDNIPGIGLFMQHDSRNAAYPTNGWYADAEAGYYFGDANYWQFWGDVRRYVPLDFIGRRHSLALYSLATFTSGEFGTDIPIYADFHIGGTNSVRGWPLGARVGQNQWLNTAEYWYNLLDAKAFRFWFIKWRMGLQLALFGDVGTAWYTGPEFGENFIAGFGGGLRLTLPVIVLLRIDVAYARDEFGLKIAIGGAEKAIAQKQRVR
jgi:outer membrane protein assembly factor BamA